MAAGSYILQDIRGKQRKRCLTEIGSHLDTPSKVRLHELNINHVLNLTSDKSSVSVALASTMFSKLNIGQV